MDTKPVTLTRPRNVTSFNRISGPVSYYYFDDIYGHKLHIFGDRHDKANLCTDCYDDCVLIQDLIKRFADEAVLTKQYIDVFLEIPYQLAEEWKRRDVPTVLYDVYDAFKDCFRHDKRTCNYLPYARFHYADIRQHTKHSSTLVNLISLVFGVKLDTLREDIRPYYNILKSIRDMFYRDPFVISDIYIGKDNGRDILANELEHWQFDNVIKALSPELFQLFKKGSNTHKIRYSLSQLEPVLRDKLYRYAYDRYSSLVSTMLRTFDEEYYIAFLFSFKEAIDRTPNVKVPIVNVQGDRINSAPRVQITVPEILVKISSVLMDVYVLSRYFRSLQWNDPTLAIMYVGHAHADAYADFFTNYLYIDPTVVDGDEISQCLVNEQYREIFVQQQYSA